MYFCLVVSYTELSIQRHCRAHMSTPSIRPATVEHAIIDTERRRLTGVHRTMKYVDTVLET